MQEDLRLGWLMEKKSKVSRNSIGQVTKLMKSSRGKHKEILLNSLKSFLIMMTLRWILSSHQRVIGILTTLESHQVVKIRREKRKDRILHLKTFSNKEKYQKSLRIVLLIFNSPIIHGTFCCKSFIHLNLGLFRFKY